MKYLAIIIFVFLLYSCRYDTNSQGSFKLNQDFELIYGKSMHNSDLNLNIYIDSILYDSRCPVGFNCFWEGNARVRFRLISNHSEHIIVLNTYRPFSNDTMIDGYKISLISLAPQPKSGIKTEQKDYIATMHISH